MPDGKTVQVRAILNGRPQLGVVPLEDVRTPGGEAEKPAAAEPAKARTWSDSTGQFRMEAVYVGRAGDSITLRKTDGAEISVPLARLSQVDQEFVAALGEQTGGEKPELWQPPAEGPKPTELSDCVVSNERQAVACLASGKPVLLSPARA